MGLSAAAIVGIIGVAVAAVGTGVSIYAATQQMEAQKKAQKFQEQARLNEAESQRQSAAYEEHQFRRRLAILTGQQSSIAAATNLDPSQGTPLSLQLDTARQGELEALNIRKTGAQSAAASELEARFARIRGSYASSQGSYGVLSSGLGGASSVLSTWSTAQGYNRPSRYQAMYGSETTSASSVYGY